MLNQTIEKYALRKVEIQSIEFGEIVDHGISEQSGLYHLLECEILVSYKQDQIRRYAYDRRAVPLAIAFRKDFDNDNISGFFGLKHRPDEDPVNILDDLETAYKQQDFWELIRFRETRRRAI